MAENDPRQSSHIQEKFKNQFFEDATLFNFMEASVRKDTILGFDQGISTIILYTTKYYQNTQIDFDEEKLRYTVKKEDNEIKVVIYAIQKSQVIYKKKAHGLKNQSIVFVLINDTNSGEHNFKIQEIFHNKTDGDLDTFRKEIDKCPNVPDFKLGCPDSDDDGIIDLEDICYLVKGFSNPDILECNGCPDQDEDGICDKLDRCPLQRGVIEFNGCPRDSDYDGIIDRLDACPYKSGILNQTRPECNGCPDADRDGFCDKIDECKEFPGKFNNGCNRTLLGPHFEIGLQVGLTSPLSTFGQQTIDMNTRAGNLPGFAEKSLGNVDFNLKYLLSNKWLAVSLNVGHLNVDLNSTNFKDNIEPLFFSYDPSLDTISGFDFGASNYRFVHSSLGMIIGVLDQNYPINFYLEVGIGGLKSLSSQRIFNRGFVQYISRGSTNITITPDTTIITSPSNSKNLKITSLRRTVSLLYSVKGNLSIKIGSQGLRMGVFVSYFRSNLTSPLPEIYVDDVQLYETSKVPLETFNYGFAVYKRFR